MKKFPAVYRHVSFRGGLHMVSEQLHYITNREEIFDFSNKKCCIYAACGVSQTPKYILYREEHSYDHIQNPIKNHRRLQKIR